jgi:hypothetical protein
MENVGLPDQQHVARTQAHSTRLAAFQQTKDKAIGITGMTGCCNRNSETVAAAVLPGLLVLKKEAIKLGPAAECRLQSDTFKPMLKQMVFEIFGKR